MSTSLKPKWSTPPALPALSGTSFNVIVSELLGGRRKAIFGPSRIKPEDLAVEAERAVKVGNKEMKVRQSFRLNHVDPPETPFLGTPPS